LLTLDAVRSDLVHERALIEMIGDNIVPLLIFKVTKELDYVFILDFKEGFQLLLEPLSLFFITLILINDLNNSLVFLISDILLIHASSYFLALRLEKKLTNLVRMIKLFLCSKVIIRYTKRISGNLKHLF